MKPRTLTASQKAWKQGSRRFDFSRSRRSQRLSGVYEAVDHEKTAAAARDGR